MGTDIDFNARIDGLRETCGQSRDGDLSRLEAILIRLMTALAIHSHQAGAESAGAKPGIDTGCSGIEVSPAGGFCEAGQYQQRMAAGEQWRRLSDRYALAEENQIQQNEL